MSRLPRWFAPAPVVGPALALTVLLGLAVAGCGADQAPAKAASTADLEKVCRAQWHDVAQTVLGLDGETDPSALASRWTSIIATIDYYETAATTKKCQQTIETQVRAISALRQFTQKLQPYDMTHQLRQVEPSVELYLTDPLPKPARDETGKLVRPPGKGQVNQAIRQLRANAAAADADLAAGWGEMARVNLDDPAAVKAALADLDQLAQDSPAWQASEQALQVIVAAIRAQEGQVGQPAPEPDPTKVPGGVPTG